MLIFLVPVSNVQAAGTCSIPEFTTRDDCAGRGVWTENSSSGSNFGCSTPDSNSKLQNLLTYATCIISSSVIPLIFALALAMFIWGVVQYVIKSDEEAKKEKGRQFMIWGIIALTVMVSVWGLVAILGNTFGIDTGFVPQVRPPSSP